MFQKYVGVAVDIENIVFCIAISHQRQSLRCDEEVHFQQNLATIICQSVGDVKITSLRYTL
jgi:hypothetical protein